MADLELLGPAGDYEKLEQALRFGADAVYLAGEVFGMRKASKNFDQEELKKAVDFAHGMGKKVHVTLNILPHDRDLIGLDEYIQYLEKIQVDAVIVSDPGIFTRVQKNSSLPIHISTQASVTNSDTVRFWKDLGAERIVLARELSLKEIQEIHKAVPDIELEVFVHGAMCISYSGRCLLSNYFTGRDANQGDCAQACRWKYHLVEETRPGEYYPIVDSEEGSFILNSKDLCMLPYLKELRDAGVSSFKIEGRVKSQYYVSTVIHAYRQALDALKEDRLDEKTAQELVMELKKTSHRNFTTGFFFGDPKEEGQNYATSSYTQNYDFIGVVKDYDPNTQLALVEERNKTLLGERIEIFGPYPGFLNFTIEKMYNQNMEEIEEANVPMENYYLKVPQAVEAGDLVRRKKKEDRE